MSLEGDLIILREEREEDQPFLVAIRNDMDTQAWSQALPPDYTLGMYQQRYQQRQFSFKRRDGRFMIELKADGALAGHISYSGLQPRLSATIGIIVAKPYWGQGIAYDAQETLLRFLFEELGLRVVRLYTQSGNPHAVALAERSGFRIAVRRRESIFRLGKLYDNLVMDLLREEYYQRHPELEDGLSGLSL